MLGNILLTLLFVLANAFFVAAEFAIVKVRISQLKVKINAGNRLAKYSEDIVYHLDSYLSATQVGVTLASLGLGWIGEPVVGQILFNFFNFLDLGISLELARNIALPLAFALISFLHIVFGELAPKSLAILYPDTITLALSIPLKIVHFIFKPFIFILNGTANLTLRLIGIEPPKESDHSHSSEELRIIIEESNKSGAIENSEHQLIENIFDFTDTPVKQIMTPRNNIFAVEVNESINDIVAKFIEVGYSRMPVYDKEIDNIIGVIFSKDFLPLITNQEIINIKSVIKKPVLVYENEQIYSVLRRMQNTHIQLGIVLNEFGGTAGLITIEDILEEIVGEIQDEYDNEDKLIQETKEAYWEVDASISISDINDFITEKLPESKNYETIGGYILNTRGNIPKIAEKITIDNYIFTILDANNRKISKIGIEYIGTNSNEEN